MGVKLSIYTTQHSNRLDYISRLLFEQLMGLSIEFVTNADDVYVKECVINYTKEAGVGYHIKPFGLLHEKKIVPQPVKIGNWNEVPAFFLTHGADVPFDVLSASFYLVSRYEEYLPFKGDKHERFDPTQSIAFQNDFLHLPIVNIWSQMLAAELALKYPQLTFDYGTFNYVNSIDVDYAYAFLEKGMIRTVGAALRDLFTGNFHRLKERLAVISGIKKDPFDTFLYILDLQRKYGCKSVFFFHVGDYDVNDKSIPITSDRFQALIKNVNDYAQVGVHPSYASNEKEGKLGAEVKRLSDVIHQPVTQSRHHFMKIKLPKSYRELIELGIKEDYSMGYASHMGFRASICSPFNFYDLDFDEATSLRVVPFCTMEATSKYYREESAAECFQQIQQYADIVKQYHGVFVSVWHNDTLSDQGEWKGWKQYYEQMLAYLH